MKNKLILVVSGGVRDFDDIYEGMMPEVIAGKEELTGTLSKIFEIRKWNSKGKSIFGSSKTSGTKISFIPDPDGAVRMLNIENIKDKELGALCKLYNLSTLN